MKIESLGNMATVSHYCPLEVYAGRPATVPGAESIINHHCVLEIKLLSYQLYFSFFKKMTNQCRPSASKVKWPDM